MDLILIIGPQAVGKMTVGQALEKRIDARLLFNHETIDLFARFLGYTSETFRLSEKLRLDLFEAFASNAETNAAKGIIFTAVVGFDSPGEWKTLRKWSSFFQDAGGQVFIIELEADLKERLKRNATENRLSMKPSKRDITFSENELLESMKKHRLTSRSGEIEENLPDVSYLKLNNTDKTPEEAAEMIVKWLDEEGYDISDIS